MRDFIKLKGTSCGEGAKVNSPAVRTYAYQNKFPVSAKPWLNWICMIAKHSKAPACQGKPGVWQEAGRKAVTHIRSRRPGPIRSHACRQPREGTAALSCVGIESKKVCIWRCNVLRRESISKQGKKPHSSRLGALPQPTCLSPHLTSLCTMSQHPSTRSSESTQQVLGKDRSSHRHCCPTM